jgi:hypothetical protein
MSTAVLKALLPAQRRQQSAVAAQKRASFNPPHAPAPFPPITKHTQHATKINSEVKETNLNRLRISPILQQAATSQQESFDPR